MRLFSFAAGLLLACSRLVRAASGTVEIDLVFPQNDTYAPAPIVPVAFAFQNSELAGYLQPTVSFTISRHGDNDSSVANGHFDMTWNDWASSDPYIQYGEALETLNTEGTWQLEWELYVASCSASGTDGPVGDGTRQRIVFTTKKGAKEPDLTAATGGDKCSDAQNLTFEISDTRDVGDFFENGKACAALAETTPSPTPCSATIEASAASSISSSLTDRACAVQTDPPAWCPEPEEEDEGSRSPAVPSLAIAGAAFLAAAVGSLGLFII